VFEEIASVERHELERLAQKIHAPHASLGPVQGCPHETCVRLRRWLSVLNEPADPDLDLTHDRRSQGSPPSSCP
jgi:hypothetical protein